MNGIRQNDKAESNVKVTGLSPNVSLRIEFEDKAKPQLKQNMALEGGFEHTVRIKEDSKKQLKLRYFGQTALNDPASAEVATVAYHSTENQMTGSTHDQTTNGTGQTSISTSNITTQTNRSTDPENDVAVNMNVAGIGISMNVNGMDQTTGTNMSTTSSTTITSSSSSTSSHNQDGEHLSSDVTTSQANTGKAACGKAMSAVDFNKMKQSVESKPFSDTKMSTAKVATKNACLSTNQIKEICQLFSMDDDKLAYAKYAYNSCTDKSNYYQVGDIFSFSATTEELNKFLEQ